MSGMIRSVDRRSMLVVAVLVLGSLQGVFGETASDVFRSKPSPEQVRAVMTEHGLLVARDPMVAQATQRFAETRKYTPEQLAALHEIVAAPELSQRLASEWGVVCQDSFGEGMHYTDMLQPSINQAFHERVETSLRVAARDHLRTAMASHPAFQTSAADGNRQASPLASAAAAQHLVHSISLAMVSHARPSTPVTFSDIQDLAAQLGQAPATTRTTAAAAAALGPAQPPSRRHRLRRRDITDPVGYVQALFAKTEDRPLRRLDRVLPQATQKDLPSMRQRFLEDLGKATDQQLSQVATEMKQAVAQKTPAHMPAFDDLFNTVEHVRPLLPNVARSETPEAEVIKKLQAMRRTQLINMMATDGDVKNTLQNMAKTHPPVKDIAFFAEQHTIGNTIKQFVNQHEALKNQVKKFDKLEKNTLEFKQEFLKEHEQLKSLTPKSTMNEDFKLFADNFAAEYRLLEPEMKATLLQKYGEAGNLKKPFSEWLFTDDAKNIWQKRPDWPIKESLSKEAIASHAGMSSALDEWLLIGAQQAEHNWPTVWAGHIRELQSEMAGLSQDLHVLYSTAEKTSTLEFVQKVAGAELTDVALVERPAIVKAGWNKLYVFGAGIAIIMIIIACMFLMSPSSSTSSKPR
ncbi:hypothetical protein CXG81DRAFT_17824 [Caulochytrium protostelioides]|uniref:Uncharacterized protein n=1 Tax=Caulochytrium protostelioides TaxID=1555241 RepID=A0A4P9XAY8_9FUNG|nr:hypothetical protein CXG81DRAFT_17824 [Caulochytrium protostelioides]|eukprot:RKP02548.1 hypothetical protein CXG81DRAFT_17824 [Caulochytrium protostelioides]